MLSNALSTIARMMHMSVETAHLLEATRLVLAETSTFDPEQAFLRFDRDRKAFITPKDICSFMKDNKRDFTLKQAEIFIRPFDDDGDRALNYTEFLFCVMA